MIVAGLEGVVAGLDAFVVNVRSLVEDLIGTFDLLSCWARLATYL